MISFSEQDWKYNNCWFDKKRKLWFGPQNLVLPETLKFPFLTIVHALNHWFTYKMIAFMNQHWWGNIRKARKSAYTSPVQSTTQESLPVPTTPGHFKLPKGPFVVQQMDFIQLPYLLPLLWLKPFWRRLSSPRETLQNPQGLGNPFFQSGALTTLCYMACSTTLSLC